MSKYLDNNGVLYLWGKIKALVGGKVDKVEGKGLSTNDFTNELKTKVDGLQNYTLPAASATTLGGVKVGAGFNVAEDGTITATAASWDDIQGKPDFSSVYNYKGSVANVAALPSADNKKGDVYNTEDTGMNYAWTGSEWDPLGQVMNIQAITNAEIDAIIAG